MRKPRLPILLGLIPLATCLAGLAIPETSQSPSAAQKKPLAQAQVPLQYHGPIQIQHLQPVLTITATPQIAYPNQTIQFTLKWNRPVSHFTYYFDWGDGQTSVVTNPDAVPPHQYSQPRPYIVSVTATLIAIEHTAAALSPASARARVIIVPQPPPPVISTLTLRPSNNDPKIGESVTFTAFLSPANPNAQYSYDFGDGTKQSGMQTIEHSYNDARAYYPTVIAFTNDGQQLAASGAVTITVVPPPENVGGQQPGSSGQENASAGQGNAGGSAKSKRPHRPPVQDNVTSSIGATQQQQGTRSSFHPFWPVIAAVASAAFVIGLIFELRERRRRRDPIMPQSSEPAQFEAASQQSKAQMPAPKFKYVPFEGLSAHEIRMMRPRHNSIGPFTLNSGLNRTENTIRF